MKKEEKTRLTRKKIIEAAMIEFGTKSYETASINTICNENQISKGLIYHNFKSKDELYLVCVELCYKAMTENIQNTVYHCDSVQGKLKDILDARQIFFNENPHYCQIFFHSILLPPNHLMKDLKQLRHDYDECLKERYRELLSQMKLRQHVTVDKALEYLMTFQEMYNRSFQDIEWDTKNIHTLIEAHENRLSELLDLMLYGLAEQTIDKEKSIL